MERFIPLDVYKAQGTEHTQQDTQHTQGIALTGSQMRSEQRLEVTQGNTRADT